MYLLEQQVFPGAIKSSSSLLQSKLTFNMWEDERGTKEFCPAPDPQSSSSSPPVEPLCFYIVVIDSHMSRANPWSCQKDVHFTSWSLHGFARQQGWDGFTQSQNSGPIQFILHLTTRLVERVTPLLCMYVHSFNKMCVCFCIMWRGDWFV